MRAIVPIAMLGITLAGCVSSPGNSLIYMRFGSPGDDDGTIVRGVVTGVYEFDPAKTRSRLSRLDKHLSAEEAEAVIERYVVRVGIRRETVATLLTPFYSRASFADFVVLPTGWSHDPFEISNESNVVNVGDIVDIKVRRGVYFQHFHALVRKCGNPPVADELSEWTIGCRTYETYNAAGFAGEYYRFLPF